MKKGILFIFFLMRLLMEVYAQNITNIISVDSLKSNELKGNWEIVFQDEFDGDSLDTKLWWAQEKIQEDSVMLFDKSKEHVFVKEGNLHIRVTKDSVKNLPYHSAILFTSKQFRRGTLAEIRCKIPKGRGLWPAFWFWKGAWDSTYQELDAFEFWCHDTERFCLSNHYWDKKKKTVSTHFKWIRPRTLDGKAIDMSKQFFTYSVYWDDAGIKLLLNNRLVSIIREDIPKEPFSLILNLSVDNGKGKSPDKNTIFPAEFIIDYVRVYKRTNNITN
jgi:beta-glucanase (GH16 family)